MSLPCCSYLNDPQHCCLSIRLGCCSGCIDPNACCGAGSTCHLACKSCRTDLSCGLDIVFAGPGRSSGWLSLPLQVLIHTGHWPHLRRCLLALGRQIVSTSHSPALCHMLTPSWQSKPACFPNLHASSGVHHPLQATDCCLIDRQLCKHCQAVHARHQPAACHKAVQASLLLQA